MGCVCQNSSKRYYCAIIRSVGSSQGCPTGLMSSRSSIATNQSDDVVDVKYSQPLSAPSVADQVVGDLIIPDEVREFINKTCGSQATPQSLNADSTVADSPAAPVDSTSGLDQASETKPVALSSCMFEDQAGRNTAPGNAAQPLGNFAQPQQLPAAVGNVHNGAATHPASSAPLRSVDIPAVGSSAPYFRSPSVPRAYQNSHEVQVSQVSQSWQQTESTSGPRIYGTSMYRTSSGGTVDLGAEDPSVRHRRNPHQMNWWARMYGYHHGVTHGYRPNYALPTASAHPPRTAASFVPSQMSPSCNQVPCNCRLSRFSHYLKVWERFG